MWRRTLKVLALSYAVKTVLLLGIWLAAPDLVRQGRDKAGELWDTWTGNGLPAAAAIGRATPHEAAASAVQAVAVSAASPAQR